MPPFMQAADKKSPSKEEGRLFKCAALGKRKGHDDKVATLTAEIDLLRLKLEHKEELLALHNYYNKRGTL